MQFVNSLSSMLILAVAGFTTKAALSIDVRTKLMNSTALPLRIGTVAIWVEIVAPKVMVIFTVM